MFSKELYRLKEQKKLVSVYTDTNNTNKFSAGYVVGVDKQHFLLALVTPSGKHDGFLLKEIDSIYMISEESLYINKLLNLIDINKTEFNIFFENVDLIKQILVFAQQNRDIISIELIESGYDDCIGFIESIDEDMCKIQEINEFGETDGLSTIKLSDITKLSCDDSDDRSIKLLYAKGSIENNQGISLDLK